MPVFDAEIHENLSKWVDFDGVRGKNEVVLMQNQAVICRSGQ